MMNEVSCDKVNFLINFEMDIVSIFFSDFW